MNEKRCPSCGRYQALENLRRKKLPRGRVRLICVACLERAGACLKQRPTLTPKETTNEI